MEKDMTIKILIAEGFEEIEAITLIDLLKRADFKVIIVSITEKKEVKGGHNIFIITDSLIDNENFDETDMLLLPGGSLGVKNLSGDPRVLELLKKFNIQKKYIGAICAAPIVLDKAGILNDKMYTCYPGTEKEIKNGKYIKKNVVIDGKLITSRGVGTAIDMGLQIVEIHISKKASEELRKKIVYKEND